LLFGLLFPGWSRVSDKSNFSACFDEATKNISWLGEHKFSKNLSLLQLEIDTALRETSSKRGSGYMKQVVFAIAQQETTSQLPLDQELQVELMKQTRTSGWPVAEFDEVAVGAELLKLMNATTFTSRY
jgi:hypothetical protein